MMPATDKIIGYEPPVLWHAPDWIRWPALAWLAFCVLSFVRETFGLERDRYGQRIGINWVFQRTLHFFGVWTGGPGDTNFVAARQASGSLAKEAVDCDAATPRGMKKFTAAELKKVAELVEMVETKVVGPAIHAWSHFGEGARDDVWRDAPNLLGIEDELASKMLRIWFGCLDGAKTIAISTRMGRNWPWWRKRGALRVQWNASRDRFAMVGALAAFAFKRGRNEPVSFLGVPKGNVLRVGRAISLETT